MVRFLICVLLLFVITRTNSQILDFSKTLHADGVYKKNTANDSTFLISNAIFAKRVVRDFTTLAVGQGNVSSFSNYLSVSPTDAKVSASGAAKLGKTGRFFLTSDLVAGNLSNNVSELFSGFKINNTIQLDLKLHIRPLSLTKYYFNKESKQQLQLKLDGAAIEYRAGMAKFERTAGDINQATRSKADSLNYFNVLIVSLLKTAESITTAERFEYLMKASALKQQARKLEGEIEDLQLQLMDFQIKRTDRQLVLKNTYKKKIETISMNADYSAFRTLWFTLRYQPFKNTYYVFDTTANSVAPRQQAFKQQYVSFYAGGEINYYFWKKEGAGSFYMNAGAGWKKDNNLLDLETVDVEDKFSQMDPAASLSRTYINKYKAYNLDSIKEKKELLFYYNVYYFLGQKGSFAPHLSLSRRYIDKTGQWDAQLGLLFEAKDKANEKSLVNIEVYMGLDDLFNQKQSTTYVKDRTTIGLRLNFPFSPGKIKRED